MRFIGKHALVTGGGGGIGRASAIRLAQEGARVTTFDLRETKAPDGIDPAHWRGVALDCTDAVRVKAALAEAEAAFGPVDVLFNNVGQSARERASLFCESEEEVWRFVIEINLMTTLRMCRLVAPGMQARGRGRILNMSSDAAFSGDLRLADYATAKMGIVGLTRALSTELAYHGITVNTICPGAIATEAHQRIPQETLDNLVAATPAGFIATAEEVGGLVAYLGSDEARFITGQTIAINGGRNML
ncbi:SDR family oxidoreductase [Paracoccus shanxieyensis]|uniref:SDR family oxidoreductase n=1 Tax=Paracoccus shanxieyensis TaxID=2675752 RepID=A0A6L6J3C6_9RHOB|nr:SDR family NAD(P)-dependent oxidoreductase [Paracoccus shanxieyensis]MTH66679.1 SDR family oxidoreductase [Paracoccus shanxieyensis]MTH89914.1 SDR family oxidoreductase [Paracoccus shanxieyensis]